MRSFRAILAAAAAVAAAGVTFMAVPAKAAQDSSYPDHAIRIVVPYEAGGGTDVIARIFAAQLSTQTKQTVVVENHGGAGGIVGASAVAHASPDGYTVLFTPQGPITIAPNFKRPLSYNPKTDLVPVAMVAEQPIVFAVNAKSPWSDFKSFVAAAKKAPGALNFGSPGVGTEMDLTVDLLQQKTGIEMVHLPFKGGGPAINALLRGDIAMMPVVPSSILPHVKGGNVKLLGTTARNRLAAFPDVPTTKELGVPDVDIRPWWGLFVPKGTPPDVVARLQAATDAVSKDKDYRGRMSKISTDVAFVPSNEFADMLAKQTARWGTVIQTSHIELK
ncbi:MAG TPA: tripartite tricarboxylate transporter substrate binding protein [Pseudolabrys sp.]|nr:tripartite tricarboxylate transporter substrate binding protein [Pseudolabrys sp.]